MTTTANSELALEITSAWLRQEKTAVKGNQLYSMCKFAEFILDQPARTATDGMVTVPREFLRGVSTLAHNYSLQAVPPDYYSGTEGDAFKNAYRRCGQALAEVMAMIATAPPLPEPAGSDK